MNDEMQLRVEPSPAEMQVEASSILKRRVKSGGEIVSEDGADALRNMLTTTDPAVLAMDDLIEAEVEALLEEDREIAPTPFADDIKVGNVRALHHVVAAAIAHGMSVLDVSRIHGLSPSTIKALQDAPAFKELVSEYKDRDPSEVTFDLKQKLMATAHDSVDLIREKLYETGTATSFGNLLEISNSMLDRTGYGKTKTSIYKQEGIDDKELERIKAGPPGRGELSVAGPAPKGSTED